MNTKLKLFLTGYTGMIGSGIARIFLQKGWEITAPIRDIKKVLKIEGVTFIEGNCEDADFLSKHALDNDAIIHTSKTTTNDQMIDTCKALLKTAEENSLTRKCSYIWCSGCLVNGDNDLVRDESVECDQPLEFVKFKIELENFIVSKQTENLKASIIRPSWLYGNNNLNYMNDYLKYSKENKEVVTYGKDHVHMNFIHVNDCGNYFYCVVNSGKSGIFNATDNNYVSSKTFCEELAKFLGVSVVNKEFNGLFKFCLLTNQKLQTKRAEEIGFKPVYETFLLNLEKVYEELYKK